LHNAGVGIPAMAIGDEDFALRRDQDIGRLIERVRTVASDSRFAERHQELSIRAELEHLLTPSIFPGPVSHPDVSFPVDVDPVRIDEQSCAKTLHELARRIKLEDGREM